MIEIIGTTFPASYNYGPLESEIFQSTANQIENEFSTEKNLLLNMTWFGPQFDNGQWTKIENLINQENARFDNLFLLSTIDPVYLSEDLISWIAQKIECKRIIRIGTWENQPYEWNWHAGAAHKLMPIPALEEIHLDSIDYVFMCLQRKPRLHRVELTNLIIESGLDKRGILTLGGGSQEYADIYADGITGPNITLKENLDEFVKEDDCGGIPCDLFGLGPMELWKKHFIHVISETEFNNWHPRFVTEKTWKPIVGMRPFIIHGQTSIYPWLRSQGFRTFNHYWPHVDVETSEDQHGTVMSVLHWLCDMPVRDLDDMYQDMLSDLRYNRDRFLEFSREQYHKMHNLFP
jgi:hypothetical protein